jgi:integrase
MSIDSLLSPTAPSVAANTCLLPKGADMARRRYQQGSLFLRGKNNPAWFGRWREDVIVGDRVKRIRKCEFLGYKKTVPTMKLAMRELELKLAAVNRPNNRPLRSETFSQFCAWWKKNVLPEFKASTQSAYSSQLRVHLVPYFGKFLMKDIDWQTIQTFIATNSGAAKSRKNLVLTLSSMWNSARAGGWVNHDPFEDLKLPKVGRSAPFFYTAEEAKLIIANAEGQYKTLYWIAAETGMRPGELAGLRIENLHLDESLIRVTHSVWGGKLQEPKSQNAKRDITITPALAEHIRSYLAVWRRNDLNLLFCSPMGLPIDTSNVRRCNLKPLCKKLGIQTKGMNAFRHCCASMMDRAGTPIKVRQERLGHAAGSPVTMVHYTHSVSEDHRSAATAVGGMLN